MADGTSGERTPIVTRRTFLTRAAATAGVVVGSGVMMGVPTIWAQKLRDITLLQVGGSLLGDHRYRSPGDEGSWL